MGIARHDSSASADSRVTYEQEHCSLARICSFKGKGIMVQSGRLYHAMWRLIDDRFAIVWQDSLLCLCYDRPPIVTVSGWPSDSSVFSRRDLSYTDIMHYLCQMALDIIKPEEVETHEIRQSLDQLAILDDVYNRAEPHLRSRENCRTFHVKLQCFPENWGCRCHRPVRGRRDRGRRVGSVGCQLKELVLLRYIKEWDYCRVS